jgi:hypothetical protein
LGGWQLGRRHIERGHHGARRGRLRRYGHGGRQFGPIFPRSRQRHGRRWRRWRDGRRRGWRRQRCRAGGQHGAWRLRQQAHAHHRTGRRRRAPAWCVGRAPRLQRHHMRAQHRQHHTQPNGGPLRRLRHRTMLPLVLRHARLVRP